MKKKQQLSKINIDIKHGDVKINSIVPVRLSKDLLWFTGYSDNKWITCSRTSEKNNITYYIWPDSCNDIQYEITALTLKLPKGNWFVNLLPKRYGFDLVLIRENTFNKWSRNKDYIWNFNEQD